MEVDKGAQEESSVHGDFSKVDAFFPVEARIVSPESAAGLVSRYSTDLVQAEFKDLPEHDDKVLSAWLRMLNAKLDAILGMLEKDREEFMYLPHRAVELSGGGVVLPFEGSAAAGDTVELKMMLPLVPPVALYVYGQAANAASGRMWVKFLPMDEEIRDRLIHYVFLRQREIFRENREQRRGRE